MSMLLTASAQYGVAACLCVPLALFTVFAYEVPASALLAPVVLVCAADRIWTVEGLLFAVSALAGLASCAVAWYLDPGYSLTRSVLSLSLLLFAPAFLFVGQVLCKGGQSYERVFRSLAGFSAMFAIAVVIGIIAKGEPVRMENVDEGVGELGSRLNATFFGLSVHGTWGVLSLAQMLCVQGFLCVGAMLNRTEKPAMRLMFGLGAASIAYLIIGSDARSAQLGLLILFFSAARFSGTSFRWSLAAVFGVVAVVAVVLTVPGIVPSSRLLNSIVLTVAGGDLAELSTGRTGLHEAALRDLMLNPIIGVGFGAFGRFDAGVVPGELLDNSSTHVYLLTVLWKGGLLFAAPFLFLLTYMAAKLWRVRGPCRAWPAGYFSLWAVAVAFILLCMTWDTVLVPSVGALVFFLAGMLSTSPAEATFGPGRRG